jgi:hypothetical protein
MWALRLAPKARRKLLLWSRRLDRERGTQTHIHRQRGREIQSRRERESDSEQERERERDSEQERKRESALEQVYSSGYSGIVGFTSEDEVPRFLHVTKYKVGSHSRTH